MKIFIMGQANYSWHNIINEMNKCNYEGKEIDY